MLMRTCAASSLNSSHSQVKEPGESSRPVFATHCIASSSPFAKSHKPPRRTLAHMAHSGRVACVVVTTWGTRNTASISAFVVDSNLRVPWPNLCWCTVPNWLIGNSDFGFSSFVDFFLAQQGIEQSFVKVVLVWLLLMWLELKGKFLFFFPGVGHGQAIQDPELSSWELEGFLLFAYFITESPISKHARTPRPFVALRHSWFWNRNDTKSFYRNVLRANKGFDAVENF